ncbi:MAG: hypothetical protein DHS20C02_15470 [Micavibrio sp.]|nr:MAG: hypothetical protein DHS20C02_15470 [Micavibrio sp.]
MSLIIQNPLDPSTSFLHEAILEACDGAVSGAGAFAFATAAGVRLLMEDKTFNSFLASGNFDLVVGIDAVTNLTALNAISKITGVHPSLNARAFLHEKKGSLFHPKVCWFRHTDGATLITGSGNLTTSGLRANWEAFSVENLSEEQANDLEQSWSDWLSNVEEQLKELDNGEVVEQATANKIIRTKKKTTETTEGADEIQVEAEIEPIVEDIESEGDVFLPDLADQVLIATIPNSGNRWKQANFTRENFENFFGVGLGSHQRVLLYHVSDDGKVGAEESRPVVSVESNNHRLELDAASNLDYPAGDQRPICVFLRVATRTFWYRLLMPGDANYELVSGYLGDNYPAAGNKLPRITVEASTLRALWPEFPLWSAD